MRHVYIVVLVRHCLIRRFSDYIPVENESADITSQACASLCMYIAAL